MLLQLLLTSVLSTSPAQTPPSALVDVATLKTSGVPVQKSGRRKYSAWCRTTVER